MTNTIGQNNTGLRVKFGDFVMTESNFIFSVNVIQDGVSKKAGEYKAYQFIVAKNAGDTGNPANDWLPIDNCHAQGSIDCGIDNIYIFVIF